MFEKEEQGLDEVQQTSDHHCITWGPYYADPLAHTGWSIWAIRTSPNPPVFSAFLGLVACSLFPNSTSASCNKQPQKKKKKNTTHKMCAQARASCRKATLSRAEENVSTLYLEIMYVQLPDAASPDRGLPSKSFLWWKHKAERVVAH